MEEKIVTHKPSGKPVKHGGSGTSYVHYGCRCLECTEANRARATRGRADRYSREIPETVPHGKASTYSNWGCRCEACSADWKIKCDTYYSRVLSAEARYEAEMKAYEAGKRKGPKPTFKKRDMTDSEVLLRQFAKENGRLPQRRSKSADERRLFYRLKAARDTHKEWAAEIWNEYHS